MKDYDENESLYHKNWVVNNLHGESMPQNLPAVGFQWVENTSQFSKDIRENCNKDSDERYFLEVDFHSPEKVNKLHNDLPFSIGGTEIVKTQKVLDNLYDKK